MMEDIIELLQYVAAGIFLLLLVIGVTLLEYGCTKLVYDSLFGN